MSYRNRPVLDRRHRPRWQEDLRTQQLLLTAFALAIALAIGIFGAAAWNGYWDAHLRPIADVDGRTFVRSEVTLRERIIGSELAAEIADLTSLAGGGRPQLIEQQINALSTQLQGVAGLASDSLVEGAILTSRASEMGISVGDAEIDAEIDARNTLPELSDVQLIVVEPLPPDAAPDEEPTDEQVEEARAEAEQAVERVNAGEDFATVAGEVSDDFTASSGGALGWLARDDETQPEYASVAADADVGEVVGPFEVERGWAVIRVADRREAGPNVALDDFLERNGISDADYRAYIRDELLTDAYRAHFTAEVAVSPQPQRRVAKILIRAGAGGEPIDERRARHILIQPLPDEADQSTATDEQWEAARLEAEEVQTKVQAEDADWFAIAEEHSDDVGSVPRGGDLGWFPAVEPGFVPQFEAALNALDVGQVSGPVRTDFGYHIVELTGSRSSPAEQADALVQQLRDDPDSFAAVATDVSEDYVTARRGGEVGWVAPYELDEQHELAIFALEPDEISDPLDIAGEGITIYRLLGASDSRPIDDARLEQIRANGFERWLEREVRAGVPVWVDPQFASSTA